MSLEDLLAEREALIDGMDEGLREALERVEREFLARAPGDPDAYNNATLTFRLLIDSGLADIVDSLPYEERARMVRKIARETGAEPEVAASAIRTMRTANMRLIEAHSRRAADSIRANMLAANLSRTPVTHGQILDSVRASVSSSLFSTGQLETQIKTAMATWDQQVQDKIGEDTGLSHYIYWGPRDGITRPFCRSILRMQRVYTDAGIEQLNSHPELHNYVPPNVRIHRGGYNCRHMWLPVSARWAEARGYKPA